MNVPFSRIAGLLAFTAFLLLLLVSLGTPVIKDIDFFHATSPQGALIRLGPWGLTVGRERSGRSLGYKLYEQYDAIAGDNSSEWLQPFDYNLSKGLIVHPFGAVFAFFASIFTIRRSIPATFLAIVLTALAFISTIIALGIDVTLFGETKRNANESFGGANAHFGRAMWMVVSSFLLLFISLVLHGVEMAKGRKHNEAVSTVA